jgi:hypothetical protein
MKPPDLTVIDNAGVHEWSGATEPLKTAATHAHLRFAPVDLAKAHDRASSSRSSTARSSCPSISATTSTRSPTCWKTATGSGRHGIVIALTHATAYKREHPTEWGTLEDILSEAAEFWKERHAAFWVFVA